MIVGATGDVGIIVTGASDGTSLAGNFIGTDRQGSAGLGNDQGVRVIGATGKATIGPGNTITGNTSDGVQIDTSSGQRIVANSIYGNGGKGILLTPGPTTTSPRRRSPMPRRWADDDRARHVQGSPNGRRLHRVLQQPELRPERRAARTTSARSPQQPTATGRVSSRSPVPTGPGRRSSRQRPPTRRPCDTSEFSNCLASTVVGSFSATLSQPVEPGHRPHRGRHRRTGRSGATAAAHSLAAERAQGGRSRASATSAPATPSDGPARNFGQFAFPLVPFGFDWSNGNRARPRPRTRSARHHRADSRDRASRSRFLPTRPSAR